MVFNTTEHFFLDLFKLHCVFVKGKDFKST